MLTALLLVWAWNLRLCFGEADLCSTYWAYDDLSLAADEELTLGYYVVGHKDAASAQPWKFGELDSFEFAASVISPDGWYAEATVEVFIGHRSDSEGLDIAKSCRINSAMPRSRRYCETAFFSNGARQVGVNATCHQVRRVHFATYTRFRKFS